MIEYWMQESKNVGTLEAFLVNPRSAKQTGIIFASMINISTKYALIFKEKSPGIGQS